MTMQETTPTFRFEPRWPVAITIAGVICLLALLPGRVRLFPIWATYIVGGAVLTPIVAVGLMAASARWLRVERTVTLFFSVVMAVVTLANLGNLIGAMLRRP